MVSDNWTIGMFASQECTYHKVPTAPGKPEKPGKMVKAFPVMEISWNFEIFAKYHGKNEKKPGK